MHQFIRPIDLGVHSLESNAYASRGVYTVEIRMNLKLVVQLSVVGIFIYTGIQFSSAYVTRTQIGHILETAAFDARRNKHSKAEIKQAIISKMNQSNTDLPYEMEVSVSGIGDRREPLEITLDYKHVVELHFLEVELSMQAEGSSKPAM